MDNKEINFHIRKGLMFSNSCTNNNEYYSLIHADEDNNLTEIVMTKEDVITFYLKLGKELLK